MNRRGLVHATLAAAAGIVAIAGPKASATPAAGVPRVVYHLSDLDKVMFVLGNIGNHFEGMGGPQHVRIAIVVHGPPLAAFRKADGNAAATASLAKLIGSGLAPYACINTMTGMHLALDDLAPGFIVADKGGVVKLAELQGEGWSYLRP